MPIALRSLIATVYFALLFAVARGADDRSTRVALVIGNQAYGGDPLEHPVSDAKDVTQSLRELGYQVEVVYNADRHRLCEAILRYTDDLKKGAQGFFYYSGHGVEVNGSSFLVPIGANFRSPEDVEIECYNLRRLMRALTYASNPKNVVVLDACRNNPFRTTSSENETDKTSIKAPPGTVVAFACGPGTTADDDPNGRHGMYSDELIRALSHSGGNIEKALLVASNEVIKRSRGAQIPFVIHF
jgi:uncharacterized caspase-like protein